jgi:hypothetical protein
MRDAKIKNLLTQLLVLFNMKLIYTIIFYSFFITVVSGQSNYPSPKPSSIRLFYIQHSLSKNTYVYDVNLKDNELVNHNPINVYRIMYEAHGQKANLSIPQRKLAYGYSCEKISDTNYKFTLAAYKNQPMNLIKRNNKYVVETIVNNRLMRLEKMFIQVKHDSNPLKFDVDYILFTGVDIKTGKPLTEKLFLDH